MKATSYEASIGDETPLLCPGCGATYTPAHADREKRSSWSDLAWTAQARRHGAYGGAFGGMQDGVATEGYVEHRVCARDAALTVKIWTKGGPT